MEDFLPFLLDFAQEITNSKDPEKTKAFWAKLAWEIETCVEAQELFPDMKLCPICYEQSSAGVIVHRFRDEILN